VEAQQHPKSYIPVRLLPLILAGRRHPNVFMHNVALTKGGRVPKRNIPFKYARWSVILGLGRCESINSSCHGLDNVLLVH
jgi:hypothetical protein